MFVWVLEIFEEVWDELVQGEIEWKLVKLLAVNLERNFSVLSRYL
jgi:hypothetical protein